MTKVMMKMTRTYLYVNIVKTREDNITRMHRSRSTDCPANVIIMSTLTMIRVTMRMLTLMMKMVAMVTMILINLMIIMMIVMIMIKGPSSY